MIRINDYYMEDDFKYDIHEFSGIPIYVSSGQLFAGPNAFKNMIYTFHVANVCEKCSNPTETKIYTVCNSCKEEKTKARYKTLESVVVTKGQIYSDVYDEFIDIDDLVDFLYTKMSTDMDMLELISLQLEDFRFHPCDNVYPQQINITDFFEDAHEEFDINTIDPEIFRLEEQLNELLKKEVIAIAPDMTKKLEITKELLDLFNDCKEAEFHDKEEEARNNT